MDHGTEKPFEMSCPVPLETGDRVTLAHGGGGRMSQKLVESLFMPAFANPHLEARHDGAVVSVAGARIAVTTDSYVVHPLLFPGGTIGDLAVNGTVNDLAMCGARPLYLTVGFILEEGLTMDTLRRVVDSMRAAAEQAGVALVAGDTKVVDKGKGDGVFINTAGIGEVETPTPIVPASVCPGDAILVSGDLGRHGTAILSVREGLEFETGIRSDTAPLWEPVAALLHAGIRVHCLRDTTRGGLSSALNEIASARGLGMHADEGSIRVAQQVRGACEILGLDPYYVACEGRFVAFVPKEDAARALDLMRTFPVCTGASLIGEVDEVPGPVILRSRIGGNRVLDMLSGEQLPRIC